MAGKSSKPGRGPNRYAQILEHIFLSKFKPGATEVQFERQDLEDVAATLGIELPKNLGDVIYSFRHRNELPESIASKAPAGKMWVITSRGRSQYQLGVALLE